ncbi:MAG: hypothetical protein WC764_01935 [Candidatus Paceibacterota bacterium]|jgi:hypothetical protein
MRQELEQLYEPSVPTHKRWPLVALSITVLLLLGSTGLYVYLNPPKAVDNELTFAPEAGTNIKNKTQGPILSETESKKLLTSNIDTSSHPVLSLKQVQNLLKNNK